jgi:hypothetical protein
MTLEIQESIEALDAPDFMEPDEMLNELELEMLNYEPRECPLIHRFTPGLYIREIFMPKDTLLTSVRHLTTHPFFIMKGDVSVWYTNIPVQRYVAPYTGITKAGTRRLLYTHEDTIWTTVHVTDLTDPDEIAQSITDTMPNPRLDPNDPRVNVWRHNRFHLNTSHPNKMLKGEKQ